MKWVSFLLVLLLVSASLAGAQDDECGLVSLFNAWARSSPEGAPTGAVFGLLVNLSGADDTLISASTEAAEAVELHEVVMDDGDVMQMRPVEGGFAVPAGGFLELKPGGLHIMLINLTAPLEAGQMLDLVLNFEGAGEITVTVPIREMGMDGDEPAAEMTEMPVTMVEWTEACAGLHVVDPWARPVMAAMPNSAAYGLLLNLTNADETLVSASSDVAEAVELHEMVMGDGDVMQMRPVEGGIVIPAGGAALLQPGGLHVMLIGVSTALEEGDEIEVSLAFAESGEMALTIPVRQPEATMMGGG